MLNVEKVLAENEPWSLYEVLKKLVEASEILLIKKDYDGHGWEEISHAVKRGKEIIRVLEEQ